MIKNGYINGRSTPLLVIQIKSGTLFNTSIRGLNILYLTYIDFIDAYIKITPWERIRMNGIEIIPNDQLIRLTDYSQNSSVDWGQFKCKFNSIVNEFKY